MRIVMVGSFPLDPSRIPGGVEAVIKNLLPHLARIPDLDLHLISCIQELKHEVVTEYAGATIHYLPGQSRLGHATDHVLEQMRIISRLRDLRPDLVHAHGTERNAAAAQRSGFPAIITVHGIRYREVVLFGGLKGFLRRWTTVRLEKRVLGRARHIFVIADYVRQAIAALTSAELYPIANPVDSDLFRIESTDDGSTILSVATIQPRKGLVHLVEALAIVRRKIPAARLRIIGKILVPDYARQLESRIAELGLQDAIEFGGFVPDEELREAFSSCAAFALCSIEESSPVSIAEALTLGKPVVATRVGGIPDLVSDGETGFLVSFGDVEAIAGSLGRLLEDTDLRKKFSKAARTRAERDFHPEAIALRTASIYRQVIEAYGGTA